MFMQAMQEKMGQKTEWMNVQNWRKVTSLPHPPPVSFISQDPLAKVSTVTPRAIRPEPTSSAFQQAC